MKVVALISEGITDQAVLEHVLAGCLGEVAVNPLQPLRDATDTSRVAPGAFSNWQLVFEYCRSQSLEAALQFNDVVVIHIDTDCAEEIGFGVALTDNNGVLRSEKEIVEDTRRVLVTAIGEPIIQLYGDRILFAIPVLSTECWLCSLHGCSHLPRIQSCETHLRRTLAKKGRRLHKTYSAYLTLSKGLSKPAVLDEVALVSVCLGVFTASVAACVHLQ